MDRPGAHLSYAKACGFCGGRPTIVWASGDSHFAVGCPNLDCSVQPRTDHRSDCDEEAFDAELGRAVQEWNARERFQLRFTSPS